MTSLTSLIELLGEEATLKLVQTYGGVRRNVPKAKPKEHELIDLLGEAAFARLHRYFGGDEIAFPVAKRWRIEVYTRKKMSPREIALLVGYSERQIHRILKGEKRAPGQFSLFLEPARR